MFENLRFYFSTSIAVNERLALLMPYLRYNPFKEKGRAEKSSLEYLILMLIISF